MIKSIFPLSVFLLTLCLVTAFDWKPTAASNYQVFILQDGIRKEVLFNDDILTLKKKPFKIELHLQNGLEGISASASFDRLYYNTPLNKRFKDWPSIPSKTMAEEPDNADKDIIVAKEEICYWYYEEGQPCRMDAGVKKENEAIIGIQTVEHIYNRETKVTLPIEKISKPIYLVFFYYDNGPDYTAGNEYERKKIKLMFDE